MKLRIEALESNKHEDPVSGDRHLLFLAHVLVLVLLHKLDLMVTKEMIVVSGLGYEISPLAKDYFMNDPVRLEVVKETMIPALVILSFLSVYGVSRKLSNRGLRIVATTFVEVSNTILGISVLVDKYSKLLSTLDVNTFYVWVLSVSVMALTTAGIYGVNRYKNHHKIN